MGGGGSNPFWNTWTERLRFLWADGRELSGPITWLCNYSPYLPEEYH